MLYRYTHAVFHVQSTQRVSKTITNENKPNTPQIKL